ncbi:MAG: ABC transporter permease, partial [Cyclobacteriaceae bacterium]|nr:ABC transporter permease [Cyclobacteriaceae bacterium]
MASASIANYLLTNGILKGTDKYPPQVFLRLFRWYCHPKLVDHIEGDLIEVYQQRLEKIGKRKADARFIVDVLLLFRQRIIKPMEGYQKLNTYGMYKSYFKIGWRNLLRSKGYSLINIGGLAVGMAVAMLIGLWVYDELSFNKSFVNYSRIAKVYHHLTFGEEAFTLDAVPHAIGAHLKNNFAEFEDVVIVNEQGEHVVGYEEKTFSKVGIYAEPHFLEMFSVPMLKGTHTALKDVNSIVLSKTLADVLVGDNAIGKVIKFNNKDNLMVAGVYEDFPDNSQ